LQPVHTLCPFFPMMMAVPVSWQKGSSKWADTSAFRSMATATPRSLGEASGSARILATCSLCAARSRKETARTAAAASRVRASGSTLRTSFPSKRATLTWSFVSNR
jgi:hypothetical protein